MTSIPSIKRFSGLLETAIDRDEWAKVDATRMRLKSLLIDALVNGTGDQIALIETALSKSRTKLIFGHDIDVGPGPETTAWKLSSDVETARLAQRARPFQKPFASDRSAREKIIEALETSNRRGATNSDIQKRTGLRMETVARVLKILRVEGIVTSRRAGRVSINRLSWKSSNGSILNSSAAWLLQNIEIAAVPRHPYLSTPRATKNARQPMYFVSDNFLVDRTFSKQRDLERNEANVDTEAPVKKIRDVVQFSNPGHLLNGVARIDLRENIHRV